MQLFGGTEVTGIVKAFDYNFENIIVEKLEGVMVTQIKMALVRTSDIEAITYI